MGDLEPLPGWPEEPPYEPRATGHRPGGVMPDPGRMVIQNYYAAPVAPVRRGPDPWTVLGWMAVAGVVTAVVLAVAVAAVAIAVAACAVTVCVAVLYLLLTQTKGTK